MEIKAGDESEKACVQCGEPGGRKRIDPYKEELFGERVVIRIHDRCYSDRVAEI